ncbi:MAG: hypothetical protein JRH01_16530 [Deltaproteobacteria bacterium]|nr:hypothetical protein [Deltaproteobacteria bacterium]
MALEFTGHVGELQVQGIDLISLDETGTLIQSLDVLMRPLGTIEALRNIVAPQMAEYLAPKSG